MPTTPLVSLPPTFLLLARTEPGLKVFLPTLEMFLQSKERLPAQLEESTVISVADTLGNVCKQAADPVRLRLISE